jgi:hypothetical protein
LVVEKLRLCYAPLIGEVACDGLVPAQLCGRIWFVWLVRVVGPEPFLDALYDDASLMCFVSLSMNFVLEWQRYR